MTDDERIAEDRELKAEAKRTSAAFNVAMVAAAISVIELIMLIFLGPFRPIVILQPLLALSLSMALTAGARALDGPIIFASRRREAPSSSSAAAAILLWLSCFGAIGIAFFVVDVVARWDSGRTACPTNGVELFEEVLSFRVASSERTLTVTRCSLSKGSNRAEAPPPNAQEEASVGSDNRDQEP
jgi:hypothetical protein